MRLARRCAPPTRGSRALPDALRSRRARKPARPRRDCLRAHTRLRASRPSLRLSPTRHLILYRVWGFLNLPNAFTLVRLALTPLIVACILAGRHTGALAIFAAAALTDVI